MNNMWMGNIPNDWKVTKLKYIGQYINGYAFKPDEWCEDGLPIIRIQDLTGSNDDPNFYKGTIPEKYRIKNGDILASWAATLDAFLWDKGEGWLNQHIFKAVPNLEEVTESYFYWLLKAAMHHLNNDNKHGIMMQHLTLSVFNNFSVPLPSIEQQKKISEEIRRKCLRTDTLIANVSMQIEKLSNYKQRVIAELVTRGVSDDIPQKDSEEDWLGTVPKHWIIERGKNLFYETDARSSDGSEELLTVSQYTGVTPRSQKNVNMFEALTLEGYKICEIGDIAANTMWLWAGAIGVSDYRGVISPSYNVYRQKDATYVPKYLDYLLRSPMLVQKYASLSTGIRASRLRLYPKDFLNIKFPVPTKEEQKVIIERIEKKVSKIDSLIAIKRSKIDKLEQFKKLLIYEYVTGKKEVQ